jgi:hypothetical protein
VLGPDGQNGSSSIYGDSNRRSAALVTTNNALFHIRNSLFLGFPEGCWYLDDAQTADAIRFGRAEAGYSVFQSMDSTRAFYLSPGVYPPFNGGDFKTFMLGGSFSNKLFAGSRDFMFRDPFNYDRPDLLPGDNAVVLTGSNFDGAYFSDVFFKKIAYRGALGTDDWLKGWTNFTPLKTNYNFPQ